MKKNILLMIAVILTACSNAQTEVPPATPESSAKATRPGTKVSWNHYENQRYGFSLRYPESYPLTELDQQFLEIGDQITVAVWDVDPNGPIGDAPIIEDSLEVRISGYPARLQTGYVAGVGGYTPQEIRRYIFYRKDHYLVLTLLAVGFHAPTGDLSQIIPIDPHDVEIFDEVVASLRFP